MAYFSSRPKVDKSLRYRWGIVGIVLPILIFGWYLVTSGRIRLDNPNKGEFLKGYVKIECPRCNRDPELLKKCSLCNGLGYIWVDTTKNLPEEIVIPPKPES